MEIKIDITKTSGLPISVKRDTLSLEGSFLSQPLQYRTLDEARPYFRQQNISSNLNNLYAMIRGVHLPENNNVFSDNKLRYDITVLAPGIIGDEFVKTIGHFHAVVPGQENTAITYPEVYEVLYGKAIFLLQKPRANTNQMEVLVVFAKEGEKVLVPPGFGHVTINAGAEPLVISNIFADGINSSYDYYKNRRGGIIYIGPTGEFRMENVFTSRNEAYTEELLLSKVSPLSKTPFYSSAEEPLYKMYVSSPESFLFCTKPEQFLDSFSVEKLFKPLEK